MFSKSLLLFAEIFRLIIKKSDFDCDDFHSLVTNRINKTTLTSTKNHNILVTVSEYSCVK